MILINYIGNYYLTITTYRLLEQKALLVQSPFEGEMGQGVRGFHLCYNWLPDT